MGGFGTVAPNCCCLRNCCHSIGATHLSNRCHPPFEFWFLTKVAILRSSDGGLGTVAPNCSCLRKCCHSIGATHLSNRCHPPFEFWFLTKVVILRSSDGGTWDGRTKLFLPQTMHFDLFSHAIDIASPSMVSLSSPANRLGSNGLEKAPIARLPPCWVFDSKRFHKARK